MKKKIYRGKNQHAEEKSKDTKERKRKNHKVHGKWIVATLVTD